MKYCDRLLKKWRGTGCRPQAARRPPMLTGPVAQAPGGAVDDGHEACGASVMTVHEKDSTMPTTSAKTNRFAIGADAAVVDPPARTAAMPNRGGPRGGHQ
ncbi:hypothetical protein [Burkholderia plantarii]|uniref:hypothetical protein n=1 Tax=Burkholderia plantarii TaxID=41899 RepID=UPI0011DF73E9|nr:hypothetical protein [Burkholderia plantarii]